MDLCTIGFFTVNCGIFDPSKYGAYYEPVIKVFRSCYNFAVIFTLGGRNLHYLKWRSQSCSVLAFKIFEFILSNVNNSLRLSSFLRLTIFCDHPDCQHKNESA